MSVERMRCRFSLFTTDPRIRTHAHVNSVLVMVLLQVCFASRERRDRAVRAWDCFNVSDPILPRPIVTSRKRETMLLHDGMVFN
jgi:hypothetical protein